MMPIKLSIVVGVLNQFELSISTLQSMTSTLELPEDTELIVLDNGSDASFTEFVKKRWEEGTLPFRLTIHRALANTGNYPLFEKGCEIAKGEIVAFMHSDVFIYQKGWDTNVRAQFDGHPELGLLGFIGSTELDAHGGRGTGTVSNMQGKTMVYMEPVVGESVEAKQWTGSEAHIHGRQDAGMTIDGSVVDGCVMIFRKSVLEQIGFKEDFPPHHFYDRMMSAQVIEAGYKVGILGIEFDHVSGQVANHESKWGETAKSWAKTHLGINEPHEWNDLPESVAWRRNSMNPSAGQTPNGWDHVIYLEAERRFLTEYRDQKRVVPLVMGRSINR